MKPRLREEAYLIRYMNEFVVSFQYYSDAIRFERVLIKRLGKFTLNDGTIDGLSLKLKED